MDKTATLTPQTLAIVVNKGTEHPHTGEYTSYDVKGTYLCRRCGKALYRADSKFASSCGWPSFDAEIPFAVTQHQDADGRRTEILCQRCGAHLGHVFQGEGYTVNNIRHCVNSASLDFVTDLNVLDTEEAIVAAGCFWGVQYYFENLPGVVKTEVGYIGGHIANPNYKQVCSGTSGHLEAIRVLYNPTVINYEGICKYFFEIHDPTQTNGQGPDIGSQYLSAVFYLDEQQRQIATSVIQLLGDNGFNAATKLKPASIFWKAEDYHQLYYAKNGQHPYCHTRVKRF